MTKKKDEMKPDPMRFFETKPDDMRPLNAAQQVEADLDTVSGLLGRSILLHDQTIAEPLINYLRNAHIMLSVKQSHR